MFLYHLLLLKFKRWSCQPVNLSINYTEKKVIFLDIFFTANANVIGYSYIYSILYIQSWVLTQSYSFMSYMGYMDNNLYVIKKFFAVLPLDLSKNGSGEKHLIFRRRLYESISHFYAHYRWPFPWCFLRFGYSKSKGFPFMKSWPHVLTTCAFFFTVTEIYWITKLVVRLEMTTD